MMDESFSTDYYSTYYIICQSLQILQNCLFEGFLVRSQSCKIFRTALSFSPVTDLEASVAFVLDHKFLLIAPPILRNDLFWQDH